MTAMIYALNERKRHHDESLRNRSALAAKASVKAIIAILLSDGIDVRDDATLAAVAVVEKIIHAAALNGHGIHSDLAEAVRFLREITEISSTESTALQEYP